MLNDSVSAGDYASASSRNSNAAHPPFALRAGDASPRQTLDRKRDALPMVALAPASRPFGGDYASASSRNSNAATGSSRSCSTSTRG